MHCNHARCVHRDLSVYLLQCLVKHKLQHKRLPQGGTSLKIAFHRFQPLYVRAAFLLLVHSAAAAGRVVALAIYSSSIG